MLRLRECRISQSAHTPTLSPWCTASPNRVTHGRTFALDCFRLTVSPRFRRPRGRFFGVGLASCPRMRIGGMSSRTSFGRNSCCRWGPRHHLRPRASAACTRDHVCGLLRFQTIDREAHIAKQGQDAIDKQAGVRVSPTHHGACHAGRRWSAECTRERAC